MNIYCVICVAFEIRSVNKGEEQSGPKSHLEVLAEMRDYRRRRQSYRAKNVHITKKSYTEVILSCLLMWKKNIYTVYDLGMFYNF